MVDRLVEAGQEKVVVVDNLVTGHRAAVHPDAVFYEGDLADQDFMRKVFKENPDVDAVIHFAAYSLVAEFMEKPLKYFDTTFVHDLKQLHHTRSVIVKIFKWRVSNLMVRLVRIVVLKPTSCQLFSKWLKVFVRKS